MKRIIKFYWNNFALFYIYLLWKKNCFEKLENLSFSFVVSFLKVTCGFLLPRQGKKLSELNNFHVRIKTTISSTILIR